jgi:hypothetical protein
MRPRAAATGLTILMAGLVGLLMAPTASAFTQNPCALVSKAKIGTVLGLQHVTERTKLGQHFPTESDGMDKAECQVLAWNGSTPTSFAGALHKLESGNGAELVIQTFQTDPGPDAQRWVNKGYDRELHAVFGAGHEALVKLGHGHVFKPAHDGAKASIGYTGSHGHGRQAIGVWFDDSHSAFMHIDLTMAKSRRVTSLVESLAKTAVPAFF